MVNKIEKLNDLRRWVEALKNSVDNHYDEIVRTLKGETTLPENCPSKESMAALIYNQIKTKLDEVNFAHKEFDSNLLK